VNEYGPWPADPLGDAPIAAVEAMERAVTVDLIGTFEPQLVCCALSDEIAWLLSNSIYAQFDYLPVRSDDRVVGLLPLRGLRDATMTPTGPTAGHAMRPLDQSILITSGTGVLRYIEEAEESPCRLVLRQTRIAGIVTISDLQKLPVRPALFLVVTHLELLMAAAIRSRFAGQFDEAWLALLGNRREGVEERWRDLNSKNLAIDRINATQFADKRRILIKSGLLQCSRSQAERELSAIERLRDSLAHASDYALTIESARSTIYRVKLAQRWIKTLQQVLSDSDSAARSLRADPKPARPTCPSTFSASANTLSGNTGIMSRVSFTFSTPGSTSLCVNGSPRANFGPKPSCSLIRLTNPDRRSAN
jgi:hypothetical protein